MVGEIVMEIGSIIKRAVGECPEVTIKLGGADAGCLIDTGAEVSTITESFYRENLAQGWELIDISSFIQVSASQGTDIPYLGYIELTLTAWDHHFSQLGFLVVKNPTNTPVERRKERIPVVLGSNVMRDVQAQLKQIYGDKYAQELSGSRDTHEVLLRAIQVYQPATTLGTVRVAGNHALLIPARTIKVIEGSCHPSSGQQHQSALLERHISHVAELPKGVTVGAALVTVTKKGRVPMQVANFSDKDVFLQPRTPIAVLKSATVMEKGLQEEDITDLVSKMEIGDLDEVHREQLNLTLSKYQTTFSKDEDDIGYCDLVSHKIVLEDNNNNNNNMSCLPRVASSVFILFSLGALRRSPIAGFLHIIGMKFGTTSRSLWNEA